MELAGMQQLGIVTLAVDTLVVQEMVFGPTLFFAVVAVDVRPCPVVFGRHLVLLEHRIDAPVVLGHVGQ